MILIDEGGGKHKYVFGASVTGMPAREIVIDLYDLDKFDPEKTVDYIRSILASRLVPNGKISIVLDSKSQS